MKLENEFVVAAPLDRTWQTLLDVERVAACLPGASIEPVGEDGLYRGAVRIKAGPVTMAYSGTVRLADVDADGHVASFDARAKETKGTGTAAATIVNRLEPSGDRTRVLVTTDLNVTGRPAQFGRGLMEDVAGKMLADFAGRLERLVLEEPPAATNGSAATRPGTASAAPAAEPVSAPLESDDARLDVGALLLAGYRRQIGIAALAALVLLAVLAVRRSKGLSVTVRYRL